MEKHKKSIYEKAFEDGRKDMFEQFKFFFSAKGMAKLAHVHLLREERLVKFCEELIDIAKQTEERENDIAEKYDVPFEIAEIFYHARFFACFLEAICDDELFPIEEPETEERMMN